MMTSTIAIPIGAALAILGFAQQELLLGFIGVSVLFEAFQLRNLARSGNLDAHPGYQGPSREYDYRPERARKKGWWGRWKDKRAREAMLKDIKRESDSRAEVDAVLEKVSREGIGSLSPAERAVLEEASRRSRHE
jgi:hypothetical protein